MKILLLFLLLSVTALAQPASILGKNPGLQYGLAAWWPFSDGKGTNAHDYSGLANSNYLYGTSLPVWTNGPWGGALYFNKSTSGVRISPQITTGTTFTHSVWVRLDGAQNAYANLITQNGLYGIWIKSGKLDFYFSGADHPSNFVITSNVWHHLVTVNNAGTVRYYKDGVADSGTISGGISFNADSIGRDSIGDSETLKGFMAGVRIYSRAISSDEVMQLYGGGLGCQ